jgi:2-keto-4-pentenoate hydratase/2-oxohepta-3-ene-1,7-dioic acid hydratase in catechol pathway
MRLITYTYGSSRPVPGVLLGDGEGERVVDLGAALASVGTVDGLDPTSLVDMSSLVALGSAGLDAVRELVSAAASRSECTHTLTDVVLTAPVLRPPRLRDYLTYPGHAANASFTLPQAYYEMPIAYDGNPNSVIGIDEEILWPPYSDQIDYELEVALVVGKAGRDLSVEQARDHIAGVTLLNDVSARDIQGVEMSVRLGPNKGKHSCNPLGPCIVTLDAIDEYAIDVEVRVNGEVWSRGNTKNRQYSFAEVVAWASWGEDLQPGEVIALGTVEGCSGIEIDRWIKPGDLLELEAAGIGTLRNRVGSKAQTPGAGLPSYKGAPFRRATRFVEAEAEAAKPVA